MITRIVQGYTEGVQVADLATELHMDQWTVGKYARLHGLPPRFPRLGPQQIEEAVELYRSGQSLAKLAHRFGVATDTVAKALRQNGQKLRPRNGWKY